MKCIMGRIEYEAGDYCCLRDCVKKHMGCWLDEMCKEMTATVKFGIIGFCSECTK
jgi:hypothetical protein